MTGVFCVFSIKVNEMSSIVNDVRATTQSVDVKRQTDVPSEVSHWTSAQLGQEIKRVEGSVKAEADRKRQEEIERLRSIARFD